MSRLDELPENDVAAMLKQFREELDALKNDQRIQFNRFNIEQTDVVSQTLTNAANVVASGEQIKTIPHNLGYVPAFQVYMTAPADYVDPNQLTQLPSTYFIIGGADAGDVFVQVYATADDTNLYIHYRHRSSTDYSPSVPTFLIRYYLLKESAD